MERLLQHEEERLEEDYKLLNELEDDLLVEESSLPRNKLLKQIKNLKETIKEREDKLRGVDHLNQILFDGWKLLKSRDFNRAEEKFDEANRLEPKSPCTWYWKANVALAKGNTLVALAYINKALDIDGNHLHSLVLKIKLLLLSGGDKKLEAEKIAKQSYGIPNELKNWLDCLVQEKIFTDLVITNSELDRRCPSPNLSMGKLKKL